jgi:hypothetical protein
MNHPRSILLDPVGDVPAPESSLVVETEVEFLRLATEDHPLLIRGARLCEWAQAFYSARRIATHYVHSPGREVQSVLPNLSAEQTSALISRLGTERFATLRRPLTPLGLVQALYPNALWLDQPSVAHAAAWLLWLHETKPDTVTQTVIAPFREKWHNTAAGPERPAYAAAGADDADALLRAWLRLDPAGEDIAALGTFPLDVPDDLTAKARRQWASRLIQSRGGLIDDLLAQPVLPLSLQRVLAEEATAHILRNPADLNETRYRYLAALLEPDTSGELLRLLPQPTPQAVPGAVTEVLAWFESDYLRFRRWQVRFGDEAAEQAATDAAREFAHWYLARYPQALMGGPLADHLSFRQTMVMGKDDQAVTIVIILDGLHAEDAQHLRLALQQTVPRLTLLDQRWVFAPLPTITEFAKDALLKGYEPATAKDAVAQAPILPERINPTHQLAQAKPGEVLVWRVMEPDTTYHHRNSDEFLRQAVESAVNRVAMTIGEIVAHVPNELPLRLIITTDHGRLLDRADRVIPVPPAMQAHGRAAWGERIHEFDGGGVVYDGDVAYLHGERFGLPAVAAEVAVLVGPGMFKTNDNKAGAEWFPHGGVAPEEVIIPWLMWERDWAAPEVLVRATGQEMAGRAGQLALTVTNPTDVAITITRLELRWADRKQQRIALDLSVNPRTSVEQTVTVNPWPTQRQLQEYSAVVTVRLPAGRQFEVPFQPQLQTSEMQQRDDDILGDLT